MLAILGPVSKSPYKFLLAYDESTMAYAVFGQEIVMLTHIRHVYLNAIA